MNRSMIPIGRVVIQWTSNMENRIDFVTIAAAAVCIAGYVAITLWYVALYDLGLSREAFRSGATVAAILIGAAVAIDYFGKKSGKAE